MTLQRRVVLVLLALVIALGHSLGFHPSAAPSASAAAGCAAGFAGGDGSSADPYQVSDAAQLAALAADSACYSSHFIQTSDIALSGVWTPIGPLGTPFTGSYDGNGLTISNLYLGSGSTQGLFGSTMNAVISDLTVRGAASTTASPFDGGTVGTLAGSTLSTRISGVRIHTTMNVDGNGISTGIYVGGMIGWAESTTIASSEILAGSTVEGAFAVGGLVGNMFRGSMSNSRSFADVRTHAASSPFVSSAAGGLVGWLEGPASITASESYGDVYAWDGTSATSSRGDSIGGAVGILVRTATMTDVVAEGDVTGLRRIGGIVGDLLAATVTDSVSRGDVRGQQYVGGAIGASSGSTSTIEGSTAEGDITCVSGSYVGGFIGWASTDSSVVDASATGNVAATGTCERIGGFAGQVDGSASLEDTSATGAVTGDDFVGGLVGFLTNADISDSYSTGNVHGSARVGGLIGIAATNARITRTRAAGNVTGVDEYVGGLAGLLGNFVDAPTPGSNVHLTESFATGSVTSARNFAGGLVGKLFEESFISDSFATGAVTAAEFVGSLVGKYMGTDNEVVRNSYGTGELTAASAPSRIGGVVGGLDVPPDGKFSSTYWDPALTGVSFGIGDGSSGIDAEGVSPLTAMQMRNSTNFVGWNFSSVWGYQCGESTAPELRWANPLATATSAGPCSSPDPEPPAPSVPDSTPATPSVPTESSTITPSPTVGPADSGFEPQQPGSASMLIGGQQVSVQEQPLRRGQGLSISAGPVSMTVRSTTTNGRTVPLAPDGSVVLARSGDLPVTASGLAPDSVVTQTLFSDPILLGTATADEAGELASTVTIPATVPLGSHTLRLQGTTKTGEGFTLDIGVSVATPAVALGANPILTVKHKVVKGKRMLDVRARGVQARCLVAFTAGTEKTKARADRAGTARTHLTAPRKAERTVTVTARVSGKGCAPVKVTRRS